MQMKQKIKIGNFEAFCLLINMLCTKIILDFLRNVAEDAGTAAWIMVLLVSVAVFVVFIVIAKIYKNFSNKDILDVAESGVGEAGKIVTGLLFMFQFLYLIPIILREFAEDIKVISLTTTPISIIITLFCIGMLTGAFLGLETLARINALSVPILSAAFMLILLLSIPRFDLSRIAPWLGSGPAVIIKKAVPNISAYSELTVLLFIMPFLNEKANYVGIGKYAILVTGFFFTFSTLTYMLVYQYPMATEFFLPIYQLARSIGIGRFLSRIEAIFILVWASSAFLYLSSGLYFVTYLFKKSFGLKTEKPLLIPFTILIFSIAFIPENLYSALRFEMSVYRNYAWIITIIIPLFLLIIASVRTKAERRKKSNEAGNE
jgi:spore germination protein (amino acid permease)